MLKQQKEEERLAKEAQRKAEEEAQRLERERKDEIERQKRETERQRKEEERQRKEEERQRKEEDKRRRQREEKERRRKEKEEQQRQKQEQQRKEEAERQQQQLLEKQRREEMELERQRLVLEAATLKKDTTTDATLQPASLPALDELSARTTVTSAPVTDNSVPDETRQRVLMNALLGSSSPLVNPHQDDAVRDEQRRSAHAMSFAPSHLNAIQAGLPPSVPPGKYIGRRRK